MKMKNAVRFFVLAAFAVSCSTEKKHETTSGVTPAPTSTTENNSVALDETTPQSLVLLEPVGSDDVPFGELAQMYKVQGDIPSDISQADLLAKLETAKRVEVGDLSENTNSDDLTSSDSFFGLKKFWNKYRRGCGRSCYTNYVPTCGVVRPSCYSGNCGSSVNSYNQHYERRKSLRISFDDYENSGVSSYNAFNPGFYSQPVLAANLGSYCAGLPVGISVDQCVGNWGQNVGGVQYPQFGGYNVNAYSMPQVQPMPQTFPDQGNWNGN